MTLRQLIGNIFRRHYIKKTWSEIERLGDGSNKKAAVVDVLDVFSGQTGDFFDRWGHRKAYWKRVGDNGRVNEFFAESVSQLTTKEKAFVKFFPNAFDKVKKIIGIK